MNPLDEKGKVRKVYWIAFFIAMMVALTAGVFAFTKISELRLDESTNESVGNIVEISVECDEWTEENVPLGVFISGWLANGDKYADQLIFDKPGIQQVAVPAGCFEATAQYASIMTLEGVVLTASDPVAAWCPEEDGCDAKLTLSYTSYSMYGLSDEELIALARESIGNTDAIDMAVAKAIQLKNTASAPEVSLDEANCVDTPTEEGDGNVQNMV